MHSLEADEGSVHHVRIFRLAAFLSIRSVAEQVKVEVLLAGVLIDEFRIPGRLRIFDGENRKIFDKTYGFLNDGYIIGADEFLDISFTDE